ncbi:AraC-like DNA-binding protein [Caulobacter ginsengisoli]|uniref:AraC-like DNA-binding protein n=1 Tax=Caulobacter ginsengisoli TaxID=400775 RepID=A0ABU0IV44_9CAUL|nr:AraC family transcriptional regulator [Caulobacter ginsengisoli]MDQ0465875.1 AraC-like DNA-binding protein [Caulobacter ginsengisoli]
MPARTADWLVRAPGDIERIEARFSGAAFAPHRHDTYAIGVTLEGVQGFDYRGAARQSLPGQMVVLHPDELHDGRAGGGEGTFRYRTAYVSPAVIQDILGGCGLPFVAGGVCGDPRLSAAVWALLGDLERPLAGLELQDALYDLARALQAVAGGARPLGPHNRQAAARSRDYIEANLENSLSLEDLERVTGHDRWRLSRDFRAMFGASPYRYLILRRLDRARDMLLAGVSGAQAAHGCGFSDQSHFCRQFKKAFGLTPEAWLGAMRRAHDHSIPA